MNEWPQEKVAWLLRKTTVAKAQKDRKSHRNHNPKTDKGKQSEI